MHVIYKEHKQNIICTFDKYWCNYYISNDRIKVILNIMPLDINKYQRQFLVSNLCGMCITLKVTFYFFVSTKLWTLIGYKNSLWYLLTLRGQILRSAIMPNIQSLTKPLWEHALSLASRKKCCKKKNFDGTKNFIVGNW